MIYLHSQDVRIGSGPRGGGQRRINTLHPVAFLVEAECVFNFLRDDVL